MAVTVCLHFERSLKYRYSNGIQEDIVGCDFYIGCTFEVMPSVGQDIKFTEDELLRIEHDINKELYHIKQFYPRYIYEEDGIDGVSIFYDGLQEIEDAGLWNDDEFNKGRITSSLSMVFSGYEEGTPYISDVMEWRKHYDGIYYPHILVKLK